MTKEKLKKKEEEKEEVKYVPLTQKYRPSTFAEVIGQKDIIEILKGMVKKGRVPSCLLFSGTHSSGKTTLSRILGRSLNCSDPQDGDPCGKCSSCKQVQHPDIVEINSADKRGIDDVRELAGIVRLRPMYKKRVIICDEAHSYTPQSFQNLLKVLEEPPAHALFCMVTSEPQKLPNTILSRCTQIGLKTIAFKKLAEFLRKVAKKEKFELEEKEAVKIAEASEGHPREALNFLEKVICYDGKLEIEKIVSRIADELPKDLVPKLVKALLEGNPKEVFSHIGSGVSNCDQIMRDLVWFFRNFMRYKISSDSVPVWAKKNFEGLPKIKVEKVMNIYKIFLGNFSLSKNYMVQPELYLDLAITQSLLIMKEGKQNE